MRIKDNKTIYSKHKENLILALGLIIFVIATIHQVRIIETSNGWQGVIAQVQVMVSVYLVMRIPKKNYLVVLVLNGCVSFMAAMQVIRLKNVYAIPGIVIPLCTIIIVSIIKFYINKLKIKANEVLEEKEKRSKEIVKLQEVSIMAMAALAETRDNDTGRHIQRTKLYVKVLTEYLYKNKKYTDILNQQMVDLIIASAPLHDIGKVGIPDSILLKPGKLTKDEFEIIKLHTSLGFEAIMKAEELMGNTETFLRYAQEIVLYHHERWDGTGYLNHLKGEEIPLSARIMTVADVYDALTSKRVYKDKHSFEDAVQIISDESGKQFDPEVVNAFIACKEEFREIAKQYQDYSV